MKVTLWGVRTHKEEMKQLTVKPTCMYTHAPTAEIQNNSLACSPQSDSCECLRSASSSANTNVKAYAKEPTKWHCRFTLCSLFYTIVPKESNSASDTHYQTCRSTAGYSSGLEHWSGLNDNHQLWNIFSPVHTPFLNALVGGRLHYIHLQIVARQLQGLCVKEKRFKCKSTQASGTPWGREIESCLT